MSYAKLKNTGVYVNAMTNTKPGTVIVPQYGAMSYSTLQRNPENSDSTHRTFKTAYGDESGACGTYVQRAIMN